MVSASPQILVLVITMQLSSASIFSTLGYDTPSSVDSPTEELTETGVLTTHYVSEVISYLGSKMCCKLRKTLGVVENQVMPMPDISQLTLKYITSDSVTTYNLSSLQTELVASGLLCNLKRLVIYAHGFTKSPYSDTSMVINDAYQSKDNIICAEQLHFIGHSLGAHLVGIAAQNLTSLTGQKIGRVTGLDPAGPCYIYRNDTKISKECAIFVDIIHTNGGVFGDKEPLGHADFIVNGGSVQSGCFSDLCNHGRAPRYYAVSVDSPHGFPAIQCSDAEEFAEGACNGAISYMGLAANCSLEGLFYLNTGVTDPWMLDEEGLNCS